VLVHVRHQSGIDGGELAVPRAADDEELRVGVDDEDLAVVQVGDRGAVLRDLVVEPLGLEPRLHPGDRDPWLCAHRVSFASGS
jgi:hypothetical protein